MGQKVNPILFRLGSQEKLSSTVQSPSRKSHFSHLFFQEIECKRFLFSLLRSRGILPRLCTYHHTSEKLSLVLDLYFTSLFFKESKLSWVRSFFRNLKRKYPTVRKVKDLKDFLNNLQTSDERLEASENLFFSRKKFLPSKIKKKKVFYSNAKKLKNFALIYKRRLLYFLLYQKRKNVLLKTKEKSSVYSVNQNHLKLQAGVVRLNVGKLTRLFGLRKLKYGFCNLVLKNFVWLKGPRKKSLVELNKFICQSLQQYSGVEEVCIKFMSTQLLFLPSFKFYKRMLIRQLMSFRRNRGLKKYFLESAELLYFVLGSFGKGNASLLSKFIVRLLEKNRKQMVIVKFLKKCLQVFFQKMPKSFLAVEGIKILIKGRFNKRRRTKKVILSEGEISLQTLDTRIDYYQTHAVTIYGTFGVKVWLSKRKLLKKEKKPTEFRSKKVLKRKKSSTLILNSK